MKLVRVFCEKVILVRLRVSGRVGLTHVGLRVGSLALTSLVIELCLVHIIYVKHVMVCLNGTVHSDELTLQADVHDIHVYVDCVIFVSTLLVVWAQDLLRLLLVHLHLRVGDSSALRNHAHLLSFDLLLSSPAILVVHCQVLNVTIILSTGLSLRKVVLSVNHTWAHDLVQVLLTHKPLISSI